VLFQGEYSPEQVADYPYRDESNRRKRFTLTATLEYRPVVMGGIGVVVARQSTLEGVRSWAGEDIRGGFPRETEYWKSLSAGVGRLVRVDSVASALRLPAVVSEKPELNRRSSNTLNYKKSLPHPSVLCPR
jgi:hypothetical protein